METCTTTLPRQCNGPVSLTGWGRWLVLTVAMALSGGTAEATLDFPDGVVDDIEVLETAGPFSVDNVQFIPAPGGHLTLDTGHIFETANQFDSYHVLIRVLDVPQTGIDIAIDKDVINNTNVHWDDFHIEIMEAVNPNFGFAGTTTPTGPAGDPMFNPGTMDISEPGIGFTAITETPQMLWFDDGPGVDPGETWKGWLNIHIPGPNGISTYVGSSGQFDIPVYDFLMWQQPSVVPEPGTLMLALTGLLSLGCVGRRRRRRA